MYFSAYGTQENRCICRISRNMSIVIVYDINLTSVILREYGDFISVVFLQKTPTFVAIGGMVLLVSYAVRGGVEVLGRLAQLFLPLTFLVFGR